MPMSPPQIPTAPTRMTTSFGPGSGSPRALSSTPGPSRFLTMARTLSASWHEPRDEILRLYQEGGRITADVLRRPAPGWIQKALDGLDKRRHRPEIRDAIPHQAAHPRRQDSGPSGDGTD